MTLPDVLLFAAYAVALIGLAVPLGRYMADVYGGKKTVITRIFAPVESAIYRLTGIEPGKSMDWKQNAFALLVFNAAGFVVVYALQRLQGLLPFNPLGFGGVEPFTAFNTAVSFVSNTNWQAYAGESTMSLLTQTAGLTVQNFLSAASGMAVMALVVRGFAGHSTRALGNFWVDMTRSVISILLPLSVLLSLALSSTGVIQTWEGYRTVTPLSGSATTDGTAAQVRIPTGPVASQIAIKQLGTNGGGFFNVNSAHPFENPTPLSNFLELLSILLIPAALCFTFGSMVGDRRQGWALFSAMALLLVMLLPPALQTERRGNPAFDELGIDQSQASPGGNMEGKEVRVGIAGSVFWSLATTAASNGSVNAMHDSFMPLAGGIQMFMMHLGEVVFGGVGSGLYGMLAFVVIAVFVAGLLVGRTPEYLGHKIEAYEIKMAALLVLIMPITVLVLTAAAVVTAGGTSAILNPGPHGFSEMFYAFTSMGNNNGSAFAGLTAASPFYTILGGIAMIIGRYWLAVPVLAMAGSLAAKKLVPPSEGTLPTHTPLFVFWLCAIVLLVGALNFLPALALGPIVEHLLLMR
jgi:potassium-transporting ATPase potassium-binding subunit